VMNLALVVEVIRNERELEGMEGDFGIVLM